MEPQEQTLELTILAGRAAIIEEKLNRLRKMEAFFKSLPDERTEAGLGPVPDDIRGLAYEGFEPS